MKVLLTGGGTGGHIYPAVAIGKELINRGIASELLYVGTKAGIEGSIVPREGIEFIGIDARGFSSRDIRKMAGAALQNAKGVMEAFSIIRNYNPDIIIGTGGYASSPIVFAGGILRKKIVLHEQNVFPGRANLFLSKFAHTVFSSYEDSHKYFPETVRTVLAGNPIRREFYEVEKTKSREELGINDGEFIVLSCGGSGGAKKINDMLLELIRRFNGDSKVRIIHVTGNKYYDKFMKILINEQIKLKENINIVQYMNDMPRYMAAADLIITRAGATTLAELMVVKTPSILIPSPNVKDNHQEYNARMFEKCGMAIVVPERDLVYSYVAGKIEEFSKDPEILNRFKMRKRQTALSDTLGIICEKIDEITKGV